MSASEEENGLLSNYISVSVLRGKPFTITRYGFIENVLRMLYGPRTKDERIAFEWLGGLGFAAHRKARRVRLWKTAQEIASRVGHGDEEEPMRIVTDEICVPMDTVEQVREIFGDSR